MESADKSHESADKGPESSDKSPNSTETKEVKSVEEDKDHVDKKAESITETLDRSNLDRNDKENKLGSNQSSLNDKDEEILSPELPSQENTELIEEPTSNIEPTVAENSNQKEKSGEKFKHVKESPPKDSPTVAEVSDLNENIEHVKGSITKDDPLVAEDSDHNKKSGDNVEHVKESTLRDDTTVAEDSDQNESSGENVGLSVTEPESSNNSGNEEKPLDEKALSEDSPISNMEGKETESSLNLVGNEDINEKESGIRPESRSETNDTEKHGSGSMNDNTEISKEGCSSPKQKSSPLSNKDVVEAAADEKNQEENVGVAEDILDSKKELSKEQENLDPSPNVEVGGQPKEDVGQEATETLTAEPMDVNEDPIKTGNFSAQDKPMETEDNVHAMARADIDNESADDAMEVTTHQVEDDPLSSTEKDKDGESSPQEDHSVEKNQGCEVEIHTDIVKNEEFHVDEESGDGEKSSDSSGKDKEISKESEIDSTKEVPAKSSEEVKDKTKDASEKTPAQEATAKEGDDDVCIIPDAVPQMMRDKLKEITGKETPATSPSNHKSSETVLEEIIEESEVVEVKETRREKRKSKDLPPVIDIAAPRPQRQAAKKAETQIKVLAAVESYEPLPDPEPTLTVIERVTEANPCQQCGLVTFCKYQLRSKDSLFYFCRELCYKEYQSPNESSVPIITESAIPPPNPSKVELARPFKRKCSMCSALIVATDERVLTWETMDFCNEDCLGKYQTALGSHCANCKGAVQNSSLGKYCVRFGYNIKQFCCAGCLEEFKKGLKVCSYCQKDISNTEGGFLAPVGDKGQFKDFCTATCMEKYEQMSSSVTPPTPCHECAVCAKMQPVRVEVVSGSQVHKLCNQPCFAAFKFVNGIVADQCDMCKKYFDKAKTENFTIFYDEAPHSFCCKTCMNVYILAKRKIVPCSWCKVKKYNFDMIKKTTNNGQIVMMCSLHCLNLYQVSASAASARRIKCDSCGTQVLAQYHLTMSDGTMRNFCSYNCVGAFQSKFSRTAIAAGGKDDSPVPTGGPKRAITRRTMMTTETETGSGGKGVALPVISSVTSLAPNGEPLSAGSSVPGSIKVRGQALCRKEQADLSKIRMPKRHKQWLEENMKKAIIAVRGKEMGLKKASRIFSVPRSTLRGKVNSLEEDVDKLASSKVGRRPVLASEMEEALVRYCLEMETKLNSLAPKDIMKIAFQVSESKGLKHPFNKKDESAGRKWLSSFLKRHSMINQKNAEETTGVGENGFTHENVHRFFDTLEPLMERINHQPHKIYNCDVTGLTVAQQETSKIVSFKGKRAEGTLSSTERASLVSLITCLSATGHFVPPVIVFPRVAMEPQLLNGAPNGTSAVCDDSGWIKTDTFLWWFNKHFLKHVKCGKNEPVILVVDSHHSHNNKIDIADVAKEHGVFIVCLPPHSAHKMQPLARALVYPIKIYYGQAVESWLRQNPGEMVTHYQVARLIGEAYNRAASVSVATNGFKETGLYPCNRNIFHALEFSAEMANQTDCEYSPQPSTGTSSVSPTPSIESTKRKPADQDGQSVKRAKIESDSDSSDQVHILDSDDEDDSADDDWE